MTDSGAGAAPDAMHDVVACGAEFDALRDSLCQRAAVAGLRDVLWWPPYGAGGAAECFTFTARRVAAVTAGASRDEVRAAFDEIERVANSLRDGSVTDTGLGIALLLKYESGALFDDAFPRTASPEEVVVEAYAVDAVLRLDIATRTAAIHYSAQADLARRDEFASGIARMLDAVPTRDVPPPQNDAHLRATLATCAEMTATEYARRADAIREDIHAGRFYEVNFTHRYDVPSRAAAAAAADAARAVGAPCGFVRLADSSGAADVISASPEMFLWQRGRDVVTMPIKGTAPRGANPDADADQARALAHSAKDRAEHTMVVDLARNDLGRVCEMGTVHARDMYRIEEMPGLHHMVTTVSGTLRADVSLFDLLAATFPAASITGAPKVEVMRGIAQYEASPRGYYCGALGTLSARGELVLSVAIRTMVATPTGYRLATGGAIVADSEAAAEWDECLLKAMGLARIVVRDDDTTTSRDHRPQ